MNDVELAYLAGIVDGEGTVTMSRSGTRTYRPAVNVDSTDRELIEWIHERCGGMIIEKKTYKSHHRQSYIWRLRNFAAVEMLAAILPFMVIERKRKRAEIIVRDFSCRGHYRDPGWKPRIETALEVLAIK